MVYHFELNNFYEEHLEFRINRFTLTALIDFIESSIELVDEKDNVIKIFMDISKAFDSISTKIILQKLQTFRFFLNNPNSRGNFP